MFLHSGMMYSKKHCVFDHARKQKTNKNCNFGDGNLKFKKCVWRQVESSKQSPLLIKLFEFQHLIITTLHDKNAKTCSID